MNLSRRLLATLGLIAVGLGLSAEASDSNEWQPVLAERGEVVLDMDFEEDFVVKKGHPHFKLGQGTHWEAKGGRLIGTQSSPEYQAKKRAQGNGHLGTAPRLQIPRSPKDVILQYSFRITEGKFTKLLPMIESGHHLRRIYFGPKASRILVDHEKTTIAENDFVLQLGQWYHVMIEIKNDEFLVRFRDGPTWYGKHPEVAKTFENYAVGITGTNRGTVLIDDLKIWKAGPLRSSWPATRSRLTR